MLALPSLRLICDQGKQLGVMPPQQARDEAAKRGHHLREVQASSEPPVWKLVARPSTRGQGDRAGDHDRARLGSQQTKPRMKEAKVKEVRLVDRSADRDVKIKLQFVRGQLEKGRIIQVYVMDTGRIETESKAPRASSIMARIREGVTDLATVAVVQGAKRPQGKGAGGPAATAVLCSTFIPRTG